MVAVVGKGEQYSIVQILYYYVYTCNLIRHHSIYTVQRHYNCLIVHNQWSDCKPVPNSHCRNDIDTGFRKHRDYGNRPERSNQVHCKSLRCSLQSIHTCRSQYKSRFLMEKTNKKNKQNKPTFKLPRLSNNSIIIGALKTYVRLTGRVAQRLERLPHDREVVGSNPGRVIPKTLKMVPAAFLSGARH